MENTLFFREILFWIEAEVEKVEKEARPILRHKLPSDNSLNWGQFNSLYFPKS